VAAALGAERFLLVSNVAGVLRDGSALRTVGAEELDSLVSEGVASGGMIPKLRAGMRASGAGVKEVRIGNLSMLDDPSAGTRLVSTRGSGEGGAGYGFE